MNRPPVEGVMTMKKQSLIFICMGVLAIFGSSAVAAGTDYLKMKSAEAECGGREKSVELEIETHIAIPMDGKSGAFGFGALTDGTNNVLVLTTLCPLMTAVTNRPQAVFIPMCSI